MRKIILCFALLCGGVFIIPSAFSQTGDVRGFVYDTDNGEPLIFTSVYLKGTTYGSITDVNGFYSISKVAPGSYSLMSTRLSYDTARVEIELAANNIITQKLFLKKSAIEIGQATVSAKREEKESNVKISDIAITTQNIKKLPSIGGEADLAQFLQVVPGVVFTGDQGGQLYIRGGSPIQNLVLLDGMTIYNPFHSIGLFSVFETDIIKSVDVLTGGFSSEYGGRISAVIDIRTRDGNKKRFAGKIATSPFLSKAIIEGPIVKLRESGSSTSFIFTAKNSYLDKTSPLLYSYVDTGGIPYNFADYYGKIAINTENGSKFSAFGFHNTDNAHFQNVADFKWNSSGFGFDYVLVPGGSNTLINGNFAFSDYEIQLTQSDEKPRFSSVNGFNFGMDFTYFISDGEIKYGFDINGFKTVFEYYNPLGFKSDQNQNTTELAGFFNFRKKFRKLVIEPGIRMQYYASLGIITGEPRFGMKYNLTSKIRFKAGTGYYTQNILSTKSDRDVVDLFTGYLSGPDEDILSLNGENVRSKIQSAFHIVAGVEVDPWNELEINIEPYYKYMPQLIEINRNKQFEDEPDYMLESSQAYGIDLLVKYEKKRIYLWATYSLAFVTRYNGEQTYPPHYDRRHNTNFVASYTLGKNFDWEINARWNLGSGFPFTKTQGFYEFLGFYDGINTNYTQANGDLGIIYDEDLNAGRLPYYHRLDFSIKKIFRFSENTIMEANASVINVYNRENIFYFDRVRYERVNQLPVIPSIGLSLSF